MTSHELCIVGAGLSGLAVARFLLQQDPRVDFLLLEGGNRAGGAIATHREAGYQAEWGPHGFLDNCSESRQLVELAGLSDEVRTAPLSTFVRYVCVDGRLVCIPQSPLKIVTAPLMPLASKIGVLRDLFKRPLPGDPSVAEWTSYRFGKAMLPFADAVYTGTYAGDIERLKINAVMAGVREMERRHGSVFKGVIQRMRSARKQGGPKPAMPAMVSFAQGMGQLPERLAEHLAQQDRIRYQSPVQRIERDADGFVLTCQDTHYHCRQLVLALPINAGLDLLKGLNLAPPPRPAVSGALIANVMLGFGNSATIPFGFGYLAPEREQRFCLGALFSSHMFEGRAAQGRQLLEVLIGGIRHPERLQLSDGELIERAYADIRQLIDLPDGPCFAKVLRPQAAIPQLEEGYTDLLDWRNRLHDRETTLHLCGFGWHGIGINDMVKEAKAMVERVARGGNGQVADEVKGVYF